MTIVENPRESYSPLGLEWGSLGIGELVLKALSLVRKIETVDIIRFDAKKLVK